MISITLHYYSISLGMNSTLSVLLPDKPSDKTFPLLYLLPDAGEDHTRWIRETSITRIAEKYQMAVVMPPAQQGCFTDMAMGYDFYTALTREIPEVIHTYFPFLSTRPETTFIAGYGMGGYGAFKAALKETGVYGAAVSISGPLDIVGFIEQSVNRQQQMEHVFGPKENLKGSSNDLICLYHQNKDSLPVLSTYYEADGYWADNNRSFLQQVGSGVLTYTYDGTGWEGCSTQLDVICGRLMEQGGK